MKNLSKQVGVYRRSDTTKLKQLDTYPLIPVGEIFGKWTVLENDWYKSSKKYTDRACLVRCQCGVERVVTYRALRGKISSSCVACRPKRARSIATMWRVLWNVYRQRGRDFHLTVSGLKFLSLLPCVYCGKEPSNLLRRKYQADGEYNYEVAPEMALRYSGIDRLDSTKGYIHGNVVPCCWDCNKIKGALPLDEFLGLIARIHAHNPTVVKIHELAERLFVNAPLEIAGGE